MSIIRTHNLTKRYGSKLAVNQMNMTVEAGDIYGFIGKNGAGKTTAMKMMLGLAFPTSGSIELFNGEPQKIAGKKIGSLIEAPGLYRNCTAYENMKRFSILSGASDSEIKDLLELVNLQNTGKKKAGKFSLGMKQRLGIAIALLGKPELMILDEPINGLDPEGIKEVRDVILAINKERKVTFLISSHLLDELAKIVTKYGIINNGVLIEEISAEDINNRCQSGLWITVNAPDTAYAVLCNYTDEKNIQRADSRFILQNCTERAAEINTALVQAGVSVSELSTRHGDIESYFIERMGG